MYQVYIGKSYILVFLNTFQSKTFILKVPFINNTKDSLKIVLTTFQNKLYLFSKFQSL